MAEARLVARVETKGAKVAADELERFSNEAQDADNSVNKLSKTSKKSARQLGGFGRNAGQAGIQVQQFVGQVQGGVNPMVALSQQSTDLGFVLGFPLLGAVVGIGAAFAATLLPALFDSKDASEELEDALTSLGEIAVITDGKFVGLTKSVIQLAQVNEKAARLQVAKGLLESAKAAEAAADIINDSTSEILSTLTVSETTIAALINGFENSGKALIDAFPENRDFGTRINFGVLTDSLVDLRDEFNLTNQEAADLLSALGQQIDDRSPESAERLGSIIADLGLKYKDTNRDLLEFSTSLAKSTNLISEQTRISKELQDILDRINLTDDTREELLERRFKLAERFRDQEFQAEIDFAAKTLMQEEALIKRKEDLARKFRFQEETEEIAHANTLGDIEDKRVNDAIESRQLALKSSEQLFGSLADLSADFGGQQTGIFRALAVSQKAFSLFSAINSIAVAQAQSAADPTAITPAQKLANVTLITSQLGGIISLISGNNFDARQQGGQFRAGQNLLVGEKGPELVQFGSGGRIADTNQTSGMNGNSNVTIINQTSGRIDETEIQQDDSGDMIIIAREVMNREVLNPNSDFNKNLDRTRNSPRRL